MTKRVPSPTARTLQYEVCRSSPTAGGISDPSLRRGDNTARMNVATTVAPSGSGPGYRFANGLTDRLRRRGGTIALVGVAAWAGRISSVPIVSESNGATERSADPTLWVELYRRGWSERRRMAVLDRYYTPPRYLLREGPCHSGSSSARERLSRAATIFKPQGTRRTGLLHHEQVRHPVLLLALRHDPERVVRQRPLQCQRVEGVLF